MLDLQGQIISRRQVATMKKFITKDQLIEVSRKLAENIECVTGGRKEFCLLILDSDDIEIQAYSSTIDNNDALNAYEHLFDDAEMWGTCRDIIYPAPDG